jgi:beta-glucosidase
MGRHAQGGRNWEGFGPDPYLAGLAMNATVSGIEYVGVQTCSKHYVGNEQENQRTRTVSANGTITEALSSNIDDRTLHELYIWPFADAVKAGTASVMCAYSRINGRYACDDPNTLSILKEELAFPGYVVSDWFATHGGASYANSGLDLEMPGNVSALYGASYFGTPLLQAVQNGSVPMKRLDDMATRVLKPFFKLEQDVDYPSVDPANQVLLAINTIGHAGITANPPSIDVRGNHSSLIRKLGAAGTVLLKNTDKYLPLTKPMNVGVFGNGAPYPVSGSQYFNDKNDPQGLENGLLDIGGGSGSVRHTTLTSPFESIRDYVEGYGGRAQALMDNNMVAQGLFRSIYPVPEVCLLFLKAWASEGYDRENLDLAWNATAAVEATTSLCPNTVVVIHGPGVVLMPWADNENVTAILTAHYPGEEIGNAVVDVLWGAQEPSGRLPYTIPRNESDYGPPPANVTGTSLPSTNFTEGLLVDYKHFDASKIEPLFEFGFGLSYTEFELEDNLAINIQPNLKASPDHSMGKIPGGWKDLWTEVATASVDVKNVGNSSGSAVPQLYVAFPQDTTPSGTPVRVLRGFSKILMEAGTTQNVEFSLTRRDMSFWDVEQQDWILPEGNFTVSVGFSSRDLKVEGKACVL